jgi:hypothetical protein
LQPPNSNIQFLGTGITKELYIHMRVMVRMKSHS